MHIQVNNKEMILAFWEGISRNPREKVAVISIGCPGREYPKFGETPTLYVDFDDVDGSYESGGYRVVSPITKEQARKILNFAKEQHNNEITCMLIHCDAGISRSPAVALALHKIYNYSMDMPMSWRLYNRHVYTTIMNEFRGVDVTKMFS